MDDAYYGLLPEAETMLTYASILLKPKRDIDGRMRGPGEIEKAAAMALRLCARRCANAEETAALTNGEGTK